MINQNYTAGLQVETLIPAPFSNHIDIHSEIRVRFNSELIVKSIVGNFQVFEDVDWQYNFSQPSTLENKVMVRGSVSYHDRCIIFKPAEPLKPNARYVIYLKANGIQSITTDRLMTAFSSVFYTQVVGSLPKAILEAPFNGEVFKGIPTFKWESQDTHTYVFQLSRHERFDTLVEEKLISSGQSEVSAPSNYTPEEMLEDGMYFVRIKALTGHWSETVSFYVQKHQEQFINYEDANDQPYLEDYQTTLPSCVYVYPDDASVQVSLKTSVLYAIFDGKLEPSDIDWGQTFVSCESYDETEEVSEEEVYPFGKWHLIYQIAEDRTYLVYQLLEEVVEDEEPDIEEDKPDIEGEEPDEEEGEEENE